MFSMVFAVSEGTASAGLRPLAGMAEAERTASPPNARPAVNVKMELVFMARSNDFRKCYGQSAVKWINNTPLKRR